MRISIERTNNIHSCSCNSCHAKNYDTNDIYAKRVDKLFDVRIGNMVNCLCLDCLEHLTDAANAVIKQEKGSA